MSARTLPASIRLQATFVPLFDPRRDRWPEHFHLRGPVIEGAAAVGSTPLKLLAMDDTRRIEQRELLGEECRKAAVLELWLLSNFASAYTWAPRGNR